MYLVGIGSLDGGLDEFTLTLYIQDRVVMGFRVSFWVGESLYLLSI